MSKICEKSKLPMQLSTLNIRKKKLMRLLQKFLQHSAPHLDWAGLGKSASPNHLVIRPNIHAQIHPERKAPES